MTYRHRYSQNSLKPLLMGGVTTVVLVGTLCVSVPVKNLVNIESLLLVVFGTLLAAAIQFSWEDLFRTARLVREGGQVTPEDLDFRVKEIIDLARRVRVEGLLSLEEAARRIEDTLLRHGLELTVDGQPVADIQRVLEAEIQVGEETRQRAVSLLQCMGGYAPAMGLIGTVLGLVGMFRNLADLALLGSSLAVALLTTLYGALLANLLFLPLAGRLENAAKTSRLRQQLTLEGVLGVARQENPLSLAQRLEALLEAATAHHDGDTYSIGRGRSRASNW